MSNRQLAGSGDLFGLFPANLSTLLRLSGCDSARKDASKSSVSLKSGREVVQSKILAAIFLCVAFLFFPGQSWAQTGLVAAYAFNEGAGTTLTDISGNGNNGTIGGANWTTAGQFRNALVFHRTSAPVTGGQSTSLQLTTRMTLEGFAVSTTAP